MDDATARKRGQSVRVSLDFVRKPRYSKLESLRRQELPPSFFQEKSFAKAPSILLTPDTDTCSQSSGSSRSAGQTLNPSQICTMCCVRPKNACFIHGQISHQVCCYPCAKMIFKKRGTCPVCRRRIEKITKNIVV
jgi:hypothetical protein